MRIAFAALALGLVASCASLRLASEGPLPGGEPVRGRDGTYEVVPPTETWVRISENEAEPNVDLSLARNPADAWLNASVLPGRFPSADAALAEVRARAETMLTVTRRAETDVAVPGPDGHLPGRLGEYCGTFDRELRSRESCFVVLAVLRDRTAYVLVGQVRLHDPEPGRHDELTTFVRSLRILLEDPE